MKFGKTFDHPFDLKGVKEGDFFNGCVKCAYQAPTNHETYPQCPNCLERLDRFIVTKEDIDRRDQNETL